MFTHAPFLFDILGCGTQRFKRACTDITLLIMSSIGLKHKVCM